MCSKTQSRFKTFIQLKMTEKQFELGLGCCTKVAASGSIFGGSLSLATASVDARSFFLPAGLVYSVAHGLVLHAGLLQVMQLPLLGISF